MLNCFFRSKQQLHEYDWRFVEIVKSFVIIFVMKCFHCSSVPLVSRKNERDVKMKEMTCISSKSMGLQRYTNSLN